MKQHIERKIWLLAGATGLISLLMFISLVHPPSSYSGYPINSSSGSSYASYPGPTVTSPTMTPGGGINVTLTHFLYLPSVPSYRFFVETYMLVELPGQRLCTDALGSFCVDGHWTIDNKEFYWTLSNSIIDYLGIVQTSHGNVIGPIRNYDPAVGYLRCFTEGTTCTIPASAPALPSYGIPTPLTLPVISNVEYLATISNVNCQWGACPDVPLPQAVILVEDTIDIVKYNAPSTNCLNQSYVGIVNAEIRAAIVDWIDFGGNIGIQEKVLVIDSLQGTSTLDALERYYYVHGYGRVKESWGRDSNSDGVYQEQPRNSSTRRYVLSGDGNWTGVHNCIQGSLLTAP